MVGWGKVARARRLKEENSKKKLVHIYDNGVWQDFYDAVNTIIQAFSKQPSHSENPPSSAAEKEVDVFIDDSDYGYCPNCGQEFNYSMEDVGRLVRCRDCNLAMRLTDKDKQEKETD